MQTTAIWTPGTKLYFEMPDNARHYNFDVFIKDKSSPTSKHPTRTMTNLFVSRAFDSPGVRRWATHTPTYAWDIEFRAPATNWLCFLDIFGCLTTKARLECQRLVLKRRNIWIYQQKMSSRMWWTLQREFTGCEGLPSLETLEMEFQFGLRKRELLLKYSASIPDTILWSTFPAATVIDMPYEM